MEEDSFIYCSIGVNNRPASRDEAEEVSELLGAQTPYAEDVDLGVFNINVPESLWKELERDGHLERKVTLKSGQIAKIDAEMP